MDSNPFLILFLWTNNIYVNVGLLSKTKLVAVREITLLIDLDVIVDTVVNVTLFFSTRKIEDCNKVSNFKGDRR